MANLNWILKVKVIQGSRSKNISQLKGLAQGGAVSKYEVNPFTNKEVMANVRFLKTGSSRSMSFRGQGQNI